MLILAPPSPSPHPPHVISVLQISKLHTDALGLFLLIIFQHRLLIILTPRSHFSSHPLLLTLFFIAATLAAVANQLCCALQQHERAPTLITACPGKENRGQAVIRVMQLYHGRSFHLLLVIKQVGAFSCCRRG